MASRVSNWIRSKRSRKEKEGKPEIRRGGNLEQGTTTPGAGRLALDAVSSIPDLSHLKTNVATIEVQVIEARKTEEHVSSMPTTTALLLEGAAHAEAEGFPARPEDIWDRAYDSLRKDNAKLVDAYEKILSSRSSVIDSASDASDPQNTMERDPNARRKQMHKLIQDSLHKTKREAEIIQRVGEAAQFVLSAKDMIDSAIRAVPQAALAWAGVCFALQIIANPISATDANRKGIVHVITRMDWYWNLSSLLLKEDGVDAGASAGLRAQLEQQVIDLCKALLAYQMKSVCSHFRKRFPQFLRSLVQWDNWDGDLRTVLDAEDAVQKDCNMYNNQQIRSHLEQLIHLKDQEMELQRDVRRILQQQLLTHLEETDQECLRNLRLTDPREDKERISNTKGGLFKDSYKWILDHPDFQQWQRNKQTHLLWIKGGAGKGKTMLLIGVIDELEKWTSCSDSTFRSFFLCQSTDAELNNATAVLRGLIYMLIIQQSCLISHVGEEYKRAGKRLFEDINAFTSLSKIFKRMLHDPRLAEAYLIIDALDECDEGLYQLLSLITETASSSTQVKWIVSSRERLDIEQQLAADEAGIKISLEVNTELVSQAIGAYIEYKVSKLPLLRHNNTLQAQVRQQLRDKADGTFLWVALVFEELQFIIVAQDVTRVLDSVGRGLDPLYDRMMAQIQERQWYNESCCQVLAVVTLAHRPLHLLEQCGSGLRRQAPYNRCFTLI